MFNDITYYLINGIPFIVYLGIVTFLLFIATALLAILRQKGKTKIKVQWHFRLAYLSLAVGLVHFSLWIASNI
jgi:hypothetical protein